jgi:single-stranded DNA-binding protein
MLQGVIVRNTLKGDLVANATLVLIDGYRQNGAARQQFLRVTFWRGLATKASELPKDAKVRIAGRLETQSWEDKQSGARKYRQVVVAHSLAPVSDLRDVPENAKKPEPDGSSRKPSGMETARSILSPACPITDADVPF